MRAPARRRASSAGLALTPLWRLPGSRYTSAPVRWGPAAVTPPAGRARTSSRVPGRTAPPPARSSRTHASASGAATTTSGPPACDGPSWAWAAPGTTPARATAAMQQAARRRGMVDDAARRGAVASTQGRVSRTHTRPRYSWPRTRMVVTRPSWVRALHGCYTTTHRRGDDHGRDARPDFLPGVRRHLLRRLRGIPGRSGVAGRHRPRTVDLGVRRLRHD